MYSMKRISIDIKLNIVTNDKNLYFLPYHQLVVSIILTEQRVLRTFPSKAGIVQFYTHFYKLSPFNNLQFYYFNLIYLTKSLKKIKLS